MFNDLPITEPMHIHSLDGELREATIVEKVGDNRYVAEYNGVRCSAIYNPFVNRFYVDDKYGIIRDKTPCKDEPCR
jgi:hypothetical protein